MKIFLVLTSLHFLFSVSAFGAAFSFAKGTRAASMSPVMAAALWPALFVASLSFLGYVKAQHFYGPLALSLLTIGLIWTTIVVISNRAELGNIDWPASFAIYGVSILAGLLVAVPHIWNNDFGYAEFSNGEFLNYSQLASFSLGYQRSSVPVPWEMYHQGLRDGIDFINATVSLITKQQPANIVQLTAALMRMAYFAALLFVIRSVLTSVQRPTLCTALIGTLFAFWNFDLFQFEISFMAAALSLSIVVSTLALISTKVIGRTQALILYAILNIALLVSYPETMIMLKCLEIAFVPLLVVHKVIYAYDAAAGTSGWNVIAEPLKALPTYMARIIGIEPIYLSDLALTHNIFVIAVVALIVLAFELVFIRRLSQYMASYAVLLVPVMIVVLHALPLVDHRSFYTAAKMMLAWLWIVPLGLAVSYAKADPRKRAVIAVAVSLFFVANLETFRRGTITLLSLDTFKSAKEADEIVRIARATIAENGVIYLDSDDPIFVEYWLQILDNSGLRIDPNDLQAEYFRRGAGQNDVQTVSSTAINLHLKPKFSFALRMPNTNLFWNPIPIDSKASLYSSHLIALSMNGN